MRQRKIGPWHLVFHWQNLDDVEKVEHADAAFTDVLRSLGMVRDDTWRQVAAARQQFRRALAGRLGHGWRNGRAWLTVYDGDPDRHGRSVVKLATQWLLLKRQHSLGMSVLVDGDEQEITLSAKLPGAGVYLSLEELQIPTGWWPTNPGSSGRRQRAQRELGATWHDDTLWLKLWCDGHEQGDFPLRDARAERRTIVINPTDLFLGRWRETTHHIGTVRTWVQLPERAYPATIVFTRHIWHRPRWPWPRVALRARIDVPGGIPIPGKGEHGWDCDDDAIFGLSGPYRTVDATLVALVADVLRTREQRGGSNWQPAL